MKISYKIFVCVCVFYLFGKNAIMYYKLPLTYKKKRDRKKKGKALRAPTFSSSSIQIHPVSSENFDDCAIFTIQFLLFIVEGHVVEFL